MHPGRGLSPVISVHRGGPIPLQEQVYDRHRIATLRDQLRLGQPARYSRVWVEEPGYPQQR
jgi:hypothetical protein